MGMVSARSGSGTRISFDWSYRGFPACTMENEFLRLTIIPQVGAKIHEMIFKPADRDLLYHHPRVELRQPVFGGNVDNWWTGGIDDALPTGAPCQLDGEELPFLGEAWSMPWTSERTSATSVCFSRDGVITPFRIERTMELRPGEPFVRQRHRITNVGTLPFSFIWGIHPGLPIGPATRIQIPARRGVVQDSWPGHRLGETGSVYQWPKSEIVEPGPQAGGNLGSALCDRAGSRLAGRLGRRMGCRVRHDVSRRTVPVRMGVAGGRRLAGDQVRCGRAVDRLPWPA